MFKHLILVTKEKIIALRKGVPSTIALQTLDT
jgi:hypothetical protein